MRAVLQIEPARRFDFLLLLAGGHVELQRSLDETNARLEDLDNKFILLLEKVESTRASVKKIEGVPSSPPEGLSVVSLGAEAADDTAADKGV